MFIAVETSDLVDSTKMPSTFFERVNALIKEELAQLNEHTDNQFSVFRGDAYQVLYASPSLAFRHALLLKLKLLFAFEDTPVHLTQALAFGFQETPKQAISENMGEVFVCSGRTLDKSASGDITIQFIPFPDLQASINLITSFLNRHLKGLTQKQAQVLYHYVANQFCEQHLIADKLTMTRQNVAVHLKRGGSELLRDCIAYFEQTVASAKDMSV
uniref:hypothetical protein n=1 Tax=Ningiella ruwaisensis TaxID=2364274 RepID=UPI0010A07804|nr:hypothetical protein [Ningiella ruwaisensis]